MRKQFLRLYDKLIIVALTGVLALFGCARKTYPDRQKTETQADTPKPADTLKTVRDMFEREVIAMYGVRPTRKIE